MAYISQITIDGTTYDIKAAALSSDILAANDAMIYKGTLPTNYSSTVSTYYTPAANCGWTYKVSNACTINGVYCEVGDMLICVKDNTAAATSNNYSTIMANWNVIQTNLTSAVVAASGTSANKLAMFSGATTITNAALSDLGATPSKIVVLDGSNNAYSRTVDELRSDMGIAAGATNVTTNTVAGWGYTKNTGTVTSVAVKINGTVKGTVTGSGTIDLGSGYLTSYTDTKNTAGSINTSSKIFLIGATEQAANPQTYSNSNVYVTNGLLFAPQIQTGTASTAYFQSQKFRGQGDAATYYHAVDFGYNGHNQVDFYEYGGTWNFWINTSSTATSDAANRVASLQLGKLVERGNTLTYPGKSGTFALTSDVVSHSHAAGVGLTGSGNASTTNDTYTYKVNLVNETVASNASIYTAGGSSKFYAVQLDKNSKLGVYVPWTDTNTTYSAGTGISLSGTTFSNSGVRSVATGSTNGTIAVNTNGTTANVAVKGLGTAAYTASTAYAASGHTHNYAGSSSAGGPLTAGITWAADASNASRTLWFSSSASTTTVGKPAFDNDLTYNPSTNLLSVGQVKIGSGCTLQYNSTNKTLDFVFA